jgi:deoxyadenosine kinase
MFIGIAGIIGAGKSTLAQSLADHLGYDTYNEPVDDNPYLDDFYADMNRWGAMMQIHLLFRRFEQHQQIVWKKEKGAVQDRTIYEDTIFARMLHEAGFIDKRDYETYLGHFNIMKRFLVYPDISFTYESPPKPRCNESKNADEDAEGRNHARVHAKTPPGIRKFHH